MSVMPPGHVLAGSRGVLQEQDAKITSLVEALGNPQTLLSFSPAAQSRTEAALKLH